MLQLECYHLFMESPKINESSIPKTLDRYELQERIGAGGMGLIYKGFDTRLKRSVAIKIISDRVRDNSVRHTIRERFFNEARAAGAISHPNIVQIYDVGEINDIVYIVMEYIEGETLEHYLKSKGPLNMEQLMKVARELCSGLAFAHRRGIVHRDIKPSNIIIEANTGISKILDFGIAKFIDEDELKLTSTGMVLGSTHYLSPEHITGKNLDGRSDIFSVGTVLYEASTGMLPFRGSNSSTILYKIVHFDPPPAHETRKDLDTGFSKLVASCLNKRITERYQKCEDIIDAITSIERRIFSKHRDVDSESSSAHFFQQSYSVRDSQLLTALVTQKKLSAEEATAYRGKAVYEALVHDGVLSEDDLAACISECLQIPWIPKGRLKSIRIESKAFKLFEPDLLRKYCVLPFFKDDSKKTVSVVIDGYTDFQSEPEISKLFSDYYIQVYVGGRNVIQRLIQHRSNQENSGSAYQSLSSETDGVLDEEAATDKRILLVEPQSHYQKALVNLFKGNDQSLTIVSSSQEALSKIRSEKFNHIWANRDQIGDELAFERALIKSNPSCDIRFYDKLGEELFEESIPYFKYREFFARILQLFLSQGTKEQREDAQGFGALAVKLARSITQNQKELDEVYFSALFYRWEILKGNGGRLVEMFNGIYRFKHVMDCLTERFDGRGPMAIKGNSIPVASRVISTLGVMLKINPKLKDWSDTEYQKLCSGFDNLSGKNLDPLITMAVLDLIRPIDKSDRQKKKIAIIDSDAEYSNQLAAHLKRISADCTVYPDGLSAFAAIKKEKPDLIISEVVVSKLDGFALAARIRADDLLQKIPLIFLSESQRAEHSTKALQLGAEDFISKSSEPQFILAKVEKILNKV